MSENTTVQTGSKAQAKNDGLHIELFDIPADCTFTIDGKTLSHDAIQKAAMQALSPQSVRLHELPEGTSLVADHVTMEPSKVAQLMYADHTKRTRPLGSQTGLTELPAADQDLPSSQPRKGSVRLGRLQLPAWLHRHPATPRKRKQQPGTNQRNSTAVDVGRTIVSILLLSVAMFVATCTVGLTDRYITTRATTFSDINHALGTITPFQLAIALTLGAIAAACYGPVHTHYTQGWSWRTPYGFLNVLAVGVIKGAGILLGLVVIAAIITGGSVYF